MDSKGIKAVEIPWQKGARLIDDFAYLFATNVRKRSDAVRLREQMTRLLRATISFKQTCGNGHSWLDMQIGPEAVLWCDPEKTLQDDLFESWVELDEKFYQAVTAASVPLEMRSKPPRSSRCSILTRTLRHIPYGTSHFQMPRTKRIPATAARNPLTRFL